MGKEENEPSHEESEVIRSTNTASYLTDVAVTKVMEGSGAAHALRLGDAIDMPEEVPQGPQSEALHGGA